MERNDEVIKRDVVEELYWDDRVDASDVKTEVSDGRVTLTGSVPSYSARGAATTDAWSIGGVRDVTNLLVIEYPEEELRPSDADLQESVERSLAWNPHVYSIDIDASVENGVVDLEGTVEAYWKKWKAEDLAAGLRGVADVKNHLAVVPTESYVDKNIASDIERALERSMYVNADDVTVKVESGKVSLSGTVPSYYARARAEDAAMYTPGVTAVEDNIAVL